MYDDGPADASAMACGVATPNHINRLPGPPTHTIAIDTVAFSQSHFSGDSMERTYDLLWHDLIQHREGKGTYVESLMLCVGLQWIVR